MTRTRLILDLDFSAWPQAIALHPSLQRVTGAPATLPSIILTDSPGESAILYMMLALCAKAMETSGLTMSTSTLAGLVERIEVFNTPESIAAALSKQGQN